MNGWKIESFFAGFIPWIMDEAVRLGIRKLYFFTREGEFFCSIYHRLEKSGLARGRIPEADVIEVSRMSTFLPSLREVSLKEFMRIWNQYPVQTMEALLKSLNMERSGLEQYFYQYDIPLKEAVRRPWKDLRVQALFQDQGFVKQIETERDSRRELLYAYLGQKGWQTGRQDTIGVVDIGWKGTIQDNLCYLYPDYNIAGFYAGLQPFLSPQPANAVKYSFLDRCPQRDKERMLFAVRPFEMLCNSPNGSAAGYAKKDGNVYAVRRKDVLEDAVYYAYAKKEQERILAGVCRYCRWCRKKGRSPLKDSRKAQKALYRFLAYPDRRTVRAYFQLRHNEEFGLGRYVEAGAGFRPDILLRAACSADGRERLKEVLKEASWPQGYLVKCWLYPLLGPYNYLLGRYLAARRERMRQNRRHAGRFG